MKIQVKVKPNSKAEGVTENGSSLIVKVKEPPIEGRANQAVIRILAEHFGVPRDQIRILSGFKRSSKVIEILRSYTPDNIDR